MICPRGEVQCLSCHHSGGATHEPANCATTLPKIQHLDKGVVLYGVVAQKDAGDDGVAVGARSIHQLEVQALKEGRSFAVPVIGCRVQG